MAKPHQITINGESFSAESGELLLDAALNNGVSLPFACRAGHCGSCCVQLVSGDVRGGEGTEPGLVHACQCRISGDAEFTSPEPADMRTVEGVVRSIRSMSSEVMEVAIRTGRAFPYHAGQYAQVRFDGHPSRPFSVTHTLSGSASSRLVWFHIRRMKDGGVTAALGKTIRKGHRVELTGPFGAAHFQPNMNSRLILVATNTGFAPIWSIAIAALRENPHRRMTVIAGGRTLESLYMGAAFAQLSHFPNVRVVPVCSSPHSATHVLKGRPTDYVPALDPDDVVYVCGAPGMVEAMKEIAARAGAVCYADPFVPALRQPQSGNPARRPTRWLPSFQLSWGVRAP